MEKEKNNNTWLIILLLIVLVVMAGYIVYDKTLIKEETAKVDDTNTQEQVEETKTTLKNDIGQVLNSVYGTFIVDKDGSVYFKPTEKVMSHGLEAPFKKDTSLGIAKTYQIEIYEPTPEKPTSTFECYKLNLTNIVSGYEVYLGNGGIKYVFFIDRIGDVYKVNFTIENSEFDYSNIEKLTEYKNIVSIVETSTFGGYSGAYSAVLIDKNNKQYRY